MQLADWTAPLPPVTPPSAVDASLVGDAFRERAPSLVAALNAVAGDRHVPSILFCKSPVLVDAHPARMEERLPETIRELAMVLTLRCVAVALLSQGAEASHDRMACVVIDASGVADDARSTARAHVLFPSGAPTDGRALARVEHTLRELSAQAMRIAATLDLEVYQCTPMHVVQHDASALALGHGGEEPLFLAGCVALAHRVAQAEARARAEAATAFLHAVRAVPTDAARADLLRGFGADLLARGGEAR
jgi:hypothetical protein